MGGLGSGGWYRFSRKETVENYLHLDVGRMVRDGALSLGSAWPDDRAAHAPRGGVVLLNAEDALGDTVRPRLDAMGADVACVVALTAVQGEDRLPVNLQRDIAALDEAIVAVSDCRLVIVDPISAYLGKTDSHNNADVRALLVPLGELADRHKVAVVAVTHLNKGNRGSPATPTRNRPKNSAARSKSWSWPASMGKAPT